MDYDQKLDLIISDLAAVKADLKALMAGAPPVPSEPPKTGGLYRFVRPPTRDVTKWPADADMTVADAEEAFQRALHGVNWRGGYIAPQTYEEAWEEIEALQSGDEKRINLYRDLDPEFAGFALLTNLFSVSKWDGLSFGVNANTRKNYRGYTIQSFMDTQIQIAQSGAGPSGGDPYDGPTGVDPRRV